MRNLTLALALCVAVVAGIHLYDTHEQDRLLILSKGDPRAFAELLLKGHTQPQLQECLLAKHRREDIDILMQAISIVERHSTTTTERIAEWAIIRGSALIGLPVPDLSVGDAQIRVSTVEKALQESGAAGSTKPSRNALALRLLAPCDNHRLGTRVLVWIASEHGLTAHALDRSAIAAVASAYNGQSTPRGLVDLAAKQTYIGLVYHLYHALRFASLRKELALAAHSASWNPSVACTPQ